jgi:magnesium chelatase subunit D
VSERHPASPVLPFTAIVEQETMKQALVLNAVNPRIGGVLIRGEKGTAKSSAVRALAEVLPLQRVNAGCAYGCDPKRPGDWCERCRATGDGTPPAERRHVRVVTLPIGATEDRLIGSIDLERAIAGGVRAFEPGLLAAAHRGILYIDEVNLLDDHLVDLLLDVSAAGINIVEREGISVSHPARFILIGTMNPEEGELRPQLLDRFGLQVTVEALAGPAARVAVARTAEAFDADPARFRQAWRGRQRELSGRIRRAQRLLPRVTIDDDLLTTVAEACIALDVRSHRAEITVSRTARTIAALAGRTAVTPADVREAMALALPHRMRRRPFEEPRVDPERLDELVPDGDREPGPPPAPNDDRPPDSPPGGGAAEHPTSTGHQASAAVLPVGEPVAPPGLLPGRRRPPRTRHRGSEGRRSLPLVHADRGWPRGCLHGTDGHLAVIPTLRAAAPHQLERTGGALPLAVTGDDLRSSLRFAHTRAAILFVVDASGSMGANSRMTAAKGAVVGQLLDAYRHRDRVGMVAFRGNSADLVLPLTRSVDLAKKRLAAVPTGGGSPLAAGLIEGLRVLERERRGAPALVPILVLVSDGRANVGNGVIRDELLAVCDRVRDAGVHLMVVDTTPGDTRESLGYCRLIAEAARGHYHRLDAGVAATPGPG